MLYQTLRALDDHLGHTFMALRQLIEGRIDHLDIVPYYGLFDIGNLLRALIDQKDDHVHIRMIVGDCLGHLL